MAKDQFEIPIARLPSRKRKLAVVAVLGLVGFFAAHTVLLLHTIDDRLARIQSSEENWKRGDMQIWCLRVEALNPGFICPDPYDQDRVEVQPFVRG